MAPMSDWRRISSLLVVVIVVAAMPPADALAGEETVQIGWLSQAIKRALPLSYLDQPPQDEGIQGARLSFRSWDGQLRQPVLLTDARSLVSVSPQPGFLHQFSELDTLGIDKPETKCRMG